MIGIKSEALLLFRKFITSKVPITKLRNLSTAKVLDDVAGVETREIPLEDEVEENERFEDVEGKSKIPNDVVQLSRYFKSSTFAEKIDQMPITMFRQRKSKPEHLYLFAEDIADAFIDLIRDDLAKNRGNIIEVNAGAGILTERLIAAGVSKLTIMDSKSKCINSLALLQKKYPNKIKLREANLFDMWKLTHQDRLDGGSRVIDLFSDFPPARWGKKLGLQVIGAVPNINFIRHVILEVVRQSGIVCCGRPCFYICMPPSVWKRLTCDHTAGYKDYRAISVFFQLFFNYKLLAEFPRKAFLPWMPYYSPKKDSQGKNQKDKDYMYLARIEGKHNLFTEVIDENYIQPLWYFISHHMVARSGRVIPHMEGWSPGCGLNLLMKDYTIFTQFGDLTPQQILQLFKDFSSWDGYQNSFIPSFESSPQKLEQLTF